MDDFAQNFAQNKADWYVNPGGGATRMSKGYQACPKIHVKGYFSQFSTIALYVRNVNRVSNSYKIGLKGMVFWRDHTYLHCKYQRYILTRCSVNLLVVFNTMVLKRVFFVIINTCVALI